MDTNNRVVVTVVGKDKKGSLLLFPQHLLSGRPIYWISARPFCRSSLQ